MTRWRGLTHNQRAAILDIEKWTDRDMFEHYSDSTLYSLIARDLVAVDINTGRCILTEDGQNHALQLRLAASS